MFAQFQGEQKYIHTRGVLPASCAPRLRMKPGLKETPPHLSVPHLECGQQSGPEMGPRLTPLQEGNGLLPNRLTIEFSSPCQSQLYDLGDSLMPSEPWNLALPPFTSSGALDIFHNTLNFLRYKVDVKLHKQDGSVGNGHQA